MSLALSTTDSSTSPEGPTPDHAGRGAHASEKWIGELLGNRHRVLRHLASGGMGHVFLAKHVTLGGLVAIKTLIEPADAEAVRSFFEEACMVSRLQHPNIVKVSDFGSGNGELHYLVMELLTGIDLAAWIAQHGAMRPRRALWILRQIASAIDYLHAQGIVHRDIKPENIIVDAEANDSVKLVDFGVAYRSRHATRDVDAPLLVVGTPLYMAPEQAEGERGGFPADIYSLAALALELLTGEPPYPMTAPLEVVMAVRVAPPALPSTHGLHAPGLDAAIEKALAHDPETRYASAKDFVNTLTRVFATTPSRTQSTRPIPLPRARRSVQELPVVQPKTLATRVKSRSARAISLRVLTACVSTVAVWLAA